MQFEQTHGLGIDEARRRVRALGAYMATQHGMTVEWLDDNRARIRGTYKVVHIDVEARVEAERVCVTGQDPGMLWRVLATKYVSSKLSSYLDPARSIG